MGAEWGWCGVGWFCEGLSRDGGGDGGGEVAVGVWRGEKMAAGRSWGRGISRGPPVFLKWRLSGAGNGH